MDEKYRHHHSYNQFSKNISGRFLYRSDHEKILLGRVNLKIKGDSVEERRQAKMEVAVELRKIAGINVADWNTLGPAVQKLVDYDF